jgi:hypothetical protein
MDDAREAIGSDHERWRVSQKPVELNLRNLPSPTPDMGKSQADETMSVYWDARVCAPLILLLLAPGHARSLLLRGPSYCAGKGTAEAKLNIPATDRLLSSSETRG